MTPAELAFQRDNRAAFLATWTQASLTQLHHDVFMGLQRHLGSSILVSPIFTRVTTETEDTSLGRSHASFSSPCPSSRG